MRRRNRPRGDIKLLPRCEWTLFNSPDGDVKVTGVSVSLHPYQPWVLCTIERTRTRTVEEETENPTPRPRQWSIEVWNYANATLVAFAVIPSVFSVADARFIAQKGWIVVQCSSPRKDIVYKIQGSSLQCLTVVQHPRLFDVWAIAVHPRLSYVLTSCNKLVILWDGENEWEQIPFKGHSEEIRSLMFHPRDHNIFASGSWDGNIKIWGIRERACLRTISVYLYRAIFKMDFCSRAGKSLLLSCHDPCSPRRGSVFVWDYKTGECLVKMLTDGFQAFFHPHLPYIFSAGRDGEIQVWSESNFKYLSSYWCNMGDPDAWFGRGLEWMGACKHSNHIIALGGKGTIYVLEVVRGKDEREEDVPRTSLCAESAKRPRLVRAIALASDEALDKPTWWLNHDYPSKVRRLADHLSVNVRAACRQLSSTNDVRGLQMVREGSDVLVV
ncbi:hypothetical protein CBR_g20067 [Chara braunii]|uniref:Uncharacterized protein n=1 Tax=Chara braunii TaxID=69332 RepID=A0A388KZF0_CHABU|nr:hypothetical protein CBR_g20067 [Chara braunii]|eukprot:GBG75437.1 hypothetical protein CBR_g20067 [Chara braunii]